MQNYEPKAEVKENDQKGHNVWGKNRGGQNGSDIAGTRRLRTLRSGKGQPYFLLSNVVSEPFCSEQRLIIMDKSILFCF